VLGRNSFNKSVTDSQEKAPGDALAEIVTSHAAVEALLNIDQVATIIGRAHWTLRRDIKFGKLRCVRIGRRIMFELSEIRRVIEEGRESHGGH